MPPTSLVARFALATTGVLCWKGSYALWLSGDPGAHPLSAGLLLVTGLLSFVLLLLACVREPPRWSVGLLGVAFALLFADYVQIDAVRDAARGGVVAADVQIFQEYSAEALLHGDNPYTTDLREAYRAFQVPAAHSTPLIDGEITGKMAYPALSVLLMVPFRALDVSGGVLYPAALFGCFALLFAFASPRWRPLVLIPFFADTTYLDYALGGVSDPVWALALVVLVLVWERPTARGIAYGLACAYKQHPWLLAAFLLIKLWRESEGAPGERLRELAWFVGVTAGTFLVVNAPFIVADPMAWWQGVTEPLFASMHVFGQGASVLTTVGLVNVPKGWYSAFAYGGLGLGLWAYWRHHGRFPAALWLFPGLAMWFGHRSLTSYWYFTALPLIMDLARARPARARTGDGPSFVPTAAVALATLGVFFGGVAFWSLRPPDLALEIVGPHLARGGGVRGTTVQVTNRSDEAITPRFQVQAGNHQARFWEIAAGPEVLQPGDSAAYRIHTDAPSAVGSLTQGLRVSVAPSDAYQPRASARIAGETYHAWSDAVPNPAWRWWRPSGDEPLFWGVVADPHDAGTVRPAGGPEGSFAVEMRLDAPPAGGRHQVLLDTYLAIPSEPVSLAVQRPAGANRLPDPDVLYGIRLVHEGSALWVLFGDAAAAGRLGEDGAPYVMYEVPAEAWATVRIDIRALFEQAGLPLRASRHRLPRFEHLDYPMEPLHLQLVLRARDVDSPLQARFGPFEVPEPDVHPGIAYERARQHPEEHLLWLAQRSIVAGNYQLARDRFAQLHLERRDDVLDGLARIRTRQRGEARFGGDQRAAVRYEAPATEIMLSHPACSSPEAPYSACLTALHRWCRHQDDGRFVGSIGPLGVTERGMETACVAPPARTVKTTVDALPGPLLEAADPPTAAAREAVRAYCTEAWGGGGVGPVEYVYPDVTLLCVPDALTSAIALPPDGCPEDPRACLARIDTSCQQAGHLAGLGPSGDEALCVTARASRGKHAERSRESQEEPSEAAAPSPAERAP